MGNGEFKINVAEALVQATMKLQGFTAQKAADGDFTYQELTQMKGELKSVLEAVNYWRDRVEEAQRSAGSLSADKNNAEKV